MCGQQQLGVRLPRTREVKPDAAAASDNDLYPETALALAIQCHANGWDKLAEELLTASRLKETKVSASKRLLDLAWSYWAGQVTPSDSRPPPRRETVERVDPTRYRFRHQVQPRKAQIAGAGTHTW